jgi:hypothetical protein
LRFIGIAHGDEFSRFKSSEHARVFASEVAYANHSGLQLCTHKLAEEGFKFAGLNVTLAHRPCKIRLENKKS